MGVQLSAEGHFDSQPILELRAILNGTRVATIEQPPLDDEDTRRTAAQRVKAERRKSRKGGQRGGFQRGQRRPSQHRCPPPAHHQVGVGEGKALAPDCHQPRWPVSPGFCRTPPPDQDRGWKQIDGGPTEATRLRLLDYRRWSPGNLGCFCPRERWHYRLYKDIVATEGPGEAHHYSSLANSLVCLTKQKFENVFSEVWLLVRYVNTAHVYSEFENELQDKKSSEYQKYKAAVEGHKKEFGKPHMGASRRQRVRGVFGEHGEGHRPGLSEDK
ncbi:hypothetical protein D6D21_07183 [Aureobasidium pullulans]|uniref:Uncharacterized protein n=1 Tax=Aureobasidium pullulans TaxID=5580 RepID=A0AB74IRZ3_AURPU|nr:hypothetical protein D6D21_07183 [Aureobasidium pullulans]